jgi:hypothetical protein
MTRFKSYCRIDVQDTYIPNCAFAPSPLRAFAPLKSYSCDHFVT